MHLIERASLLLLVGGSLFEFGTGVLNIQVFYPWHFNFVREHYYGAWVFIAALTAHVLVKLPTVVRAYRAQGLKNVLADASLTNHTLCKVVRDRSYDAVTLRIWGTGLDYTEDANAAVERFAAAGVNVVRSTEPLETWPGVMSTLS